MGYDIIGDIHGQADKLDRLLGNMGYACSGGVWRHPEFAERVWRYVKGRAEDLPRGKGMSR